MSGPIEFIEDISMYSPTPRKPKSPQQEIMMAPSVAREQLSQQDYQGFGMDLDRPLPAMPSYFPGELFTGPLPPGSPGGPPLPPPSGTTDVRNLVSQKGIDNDLNCRDVDDHIKGCSVCGRLHKSNAHIYIGIIIFLIIICVFLGRKFFE